MGEATALMPERTDELVSLLGDAGKAARGIEQARRSGAVLSSEGARLLEEYPQRWVALHDGALIASEDTLDALLAEIDRIAPGIRSHVLVRFIDRAEQTLIL